MMFERGQMRNKKISIDDYCPMNINVSSFSSISYYSNVRLISKIELEQNFQPIIFNSHLKLSLGVL